MPCMMQRPYKEYLDDRDSINKKQLKRKINNHRSYYKCKKTRTNENIDQGIPTSSFNLSDINSYASGDVGLINNFQLNDGRSIETEGIHWEPEIDQEFRNSHSQSKNVSEELLSTLKRRTSLATSSVLKKKCSKVDSRIISDHSKFSDSDSDDEVIPKKDYKEMESKLRTTKTLLKEEQKLQQTSNIEREDLRNQVKTKEEEIKLLEGKLNRVNQLNVDLQLALKEKVACMDSSASKESLKTIKIGNCRIDERQFQMVYSQNNNSIFVKDLAVLVWSKDGLLNKSVSGTVCPQLKSSNSVARPPLTPDKLIDMADLLRKRLIDQGASPISAGLKLMNKQIGEKIQDLRKRNRRMLINSKNASGGVVMNENGSSTSRQPNRSLFPQFETEDINSQSGEIGGGLIISED